MAFLDNSGDIILDAVLTDEGRQRLAKGDGSFRIVKFALGDDEINYGLYDYNASTAEKDLTILQTPILEAFTNNASSMKSKLMTLATQNLLYLPTMILNTVNNSSVNTYGSDGNFVVLVNRNTIDNKNLGLTTSIGFNSSDNHVVGTLFGEGPEDGGGYIKIDAGINSTDVTTIDPSLIETQFQIEIDERLGMPISIDGLTSVRAVSTDDDNISTYIFSKNANPKFVYTPLQRSLKYRSTPFEGPLASTIEFKIASSIALRSSDYLFDRLGNTTTYPNAGGQDSVVRYIDSIVRVSGLTTGYSLDIPVRFAKL